MKLLVIRMVARSRLGILRCERIIEFVFETFDINSLSSAGLNEKKAISEPEIIAEAKIKTRITSRTMKAPNEKFPVKILANICGNNK